MSARWRVKKVADTEAEGANNVALAACAFSRTELSSVRPRAAPPQVWARAGRIDRHTPTLPSLARRGAP